MQVECEHSIFETDPVAVASITVIGKLLSGKGMTPAGVQEFLWQEFFWDPTQWWDTRRSRNTHRHPDFRHKNYKLPELCVDGWNKAIAVDSQLAMWDAQGDAGMRRPHESASTPVPRPSDEGDLELRRCRELCEDGQVCEAVDALNLLVQQGCYIPKNLFYYILKRCTALKDLVMGRRIHVLTVSCGYKGDAFLATHLIGMYALHGRLEEAMGVFSKVIPPSAYMWASIIFAYAKHGEPKLAIGLYRQMCESTVKPDNRIFVAVLKACASARELAAGNEVHDHILASEEKPDMFVLNSLVDMYAKCGSLEDARRVFDGLPKRDVVTWTALIAGYVQHGMGEEALNVYSSMQQEDIAPPDYVTFVCLLQACATVGVAGLDRGKQLHALIQERGLQHDVVVATSLVNMYSNCGCLEDARRVFDWLPQKNLVTWNAIIAGYAQQGMCQEAFSLYSSMQQEGITSPDALTFVSVLQACASLAALPLGKHIHSQIEEQGLQADVVVGSSLVSMYAKCGSMVNSQQVFDSLPERDVVTWNAIILGYARQGDSEAVFDMFETMTQDGIQPNGITFLSVLTVCSHVGLVDKGRKCFEAMATDYGISPTIEHYTCMMDLLGRAGHLDDALRIGMSIPFRPSNAVWVNLLGACRKWNSVEVGRQAFEFAVGIDENDSAPYVLMSNIFADAQMWKDAKEMQARRVKFGAWKKPGQSWWTDMDGMVHSFLVADGKLPVKTYPGLDGKADGCGDLNLALTDTKSHHSINAITCQKAHGTVSSN